MLESGLDSLRIRGSNDDRDPTLVRLAQPRNVFDVVEHERVFEGHGRVSLDRDLRHLAAGCAEPSFSHN
jgi:hypothetical protein